MGRASTPFAHVGRCRALVERDHDLRVLSEQASVVSKGATRLVLVTGEAGVGKTRLTAEFTGSLPEDWSVVSVRADEPDDPADVPVPEPAVCIVDDIQSFDPAVIDAISQRCGPGSTPRLWIATYRLGSLPTGSATAAAIARLLRQPNALELRLPPLSQKGMAEMVEQMRGVDASMDDAYVSEIHARTNGNPFFAEAVLGSHDPTVPWTVTESVLARLEPLDDEAKELANLLALADVALDDALVGELDIGELSLQALVDSGIAERVTGGVRLRHALVGEALVDRLLPDQRRGLHHAIAVALEATGDGRHDLLARQWSAAGDVARAARAAVIAADGFSVRRMYASASDLYVTALDAPPPDVLEHAKLLERAAAAAANAGRGDEALAWAMEAERRYRQTTEPWRASSVWLNPGLRFVRAPKPQTEELVAGSDARLLREAGKALAAGDREQAIAKARSAIAVSDEGAKGWTVFDGLLFASSAGASSWAEAEGKRRLASARAAANASDAALALTALAGMTFSHGEVGEALRIGRAALAEAMQESESFIWTHVQFMLGAVLALSGNLEEAEDLAERIRVAGQPMFELFADAVLSIVEFSRGDIERAREHSERMEPAFAWPVPSVYLVAGMTGLGQIALVTGDAHDALALFDRADRMRPEVLGTHLGDRLLYGALAAVKLGDRIRLRETVRRALDLARHASGPANQAVADAVVAIEARHRGEHRLASTRFEAAAAAWERAPRRVLAAHAWCDAARAAVRDQDASTARRAVARAEALAGELRPIREAASSIRRTIEAIKPGLPRSIESLTARERDAARLVAAGRTNRQIAAELFVSEKTVRNMLTFVFAKLGVTRRTEAMALLHKLEAFREG